MSKLLRKAVRGVTGLDAYAFRELVASRYGELPDLDEAWEVFEPVAANLVGSCYDTLEDPRFDVVVAKADAADVEVRGIAYEGVGMGLGLIDELFPNRSRLTEFMTGPGRNYPALLVIGAGLVLPRAPFVNLDKYVAKHDPLLRWFVLDGYGFYDGFFNWRRAVDFRTMPQRVLKMRDRYGRRAYDQGMGRSLWFSTGAGVDRIIDSIAGFPPHRKPDLWSGIGLACAYAAGVMDAGAIEALLDAAGEYAPDLAVGSAVAAEIRVQTGHPAPHTELACDVIWGRCAGLARPVTSDVVAEIATDARKGLPADTDDTPAYEAWRRRIRAAYVPAAAPSARSVPPVPSVPSASDHQYAQS